MLVLLFSAIPTKTNTDGYVAGGRLGGPIGGAGVCLRQPQRKLYGLERALCEHDGQLARTLHIQYAPPARLQMLGRKTVSDASFRSFSHGNGVPLTSDAGVS